MYKQIKELADEAIALQNKDRMDAVLREISELAAQGSACVEGLKGHLMTAGGASLIGFDAVAEVHGDPIIEPSPEIVEVVRPTLRPAGHAAKHL